MKLYIKNMVCSRCILVVKSELEKLGLHPVSLNLGEIEIQENDIHSEKDNLLINLRKLGFDLLDDKRSKIIDKIKTLIIDLIQNKNNTLKVNLSKYLSDHLFQDYNSLSNLFSEVEHSTIEHFFIHQRIEKVKELLMYDELTLSQIADQLNYSSVGYLSNQFKKVTGFTPTYFKKLKDKKRRQIEDL